MGTHLQEIKTKRPLFAIRGVDTETKEERTYYKAQANNQQRLFELVFFEAPRDRNVYILVGGAMGGGKTKSLVGLVIGFCLKFPGSRVYVCRKDFTDLRDTFYKDFVSICPPSIIKRPKGGLTDRTEAAHEVLLNNGSLVMFRELKDDTGKFGLEVNMVVIEQAEEIEQSIYQTMDTRLRPWIGAPEKSPYVMAIAANPHPGWIKTMFVDNDTAPPEKKNENHYYLHFSPKNNDDLLRQRPHYVTDLAKKFPPSWVKRYLDGDWDIAVEGAIYPEYDSHLHEVNPFPIPDSWPRFMCLDPHLAKPFYVVYAAQCPGGPTFIYDELVGPPNMTSRDFLQMMVARERSHWRVNQGSYTRIIDYSLASNLHKKNEGKSLYAIIAEIGLKFKNADKSNKWENIALVKDQLAPGANQPPLLYFTKNCTGTIAQMKNYQYHPHIEGTDWKEKILKEDDDFQDCVQYIIADEPWKVREVATEEAISYVGGQRS